MIQWEHSAILSTFIKLSIVIKIFVFFYFWVAVLHRFYCTNKEQCCCKQFKDILMLFVHAFCTLCIYVVHIFLPNILLHQKVFNINMPTKYAFVLINCGLFGKANFFPLETIPIVTEPILPKGFMQKVNFYSV